MSHARPKLGKIHLDDFDLDLDAILYASYEDISEAAEELPPIIEWINAQLQGITEQRIVKKQTIRELEAKVYFDLKNGAFEREGYADKMTETAVDKAINLNEKVQAAWREYATLVGWEQRLENLRFSLNAKLDLVRSSEATRRRLIETDKD